jgi:hypothetical protein
MLCQAAMRSIVLNARETYHRYARRDIILVLDKTAFMLHLLQLMLEVLCLYQKVELASNQA